MVNGRRDVHPRVPDGESPSAFFSFPALDETLGDPGELLLGPEEVSLESLATAPATIPASVLAYSFGGEDGLQSVEEVVRARAENMRSGKVSKFDAYYLPQTPLPYGLWEYKCGTCRFYTERRGMNADGGRCEVVGQQGDPFGGERVHPSAWCAFWMPQRGREWFEYASDRLESRTND